MLGSLISTHAQNAYFIDGYHGGVWGHYPEWNTRFMVDQLQKNPKWNINIEIEPDTWDTAMIKDPAAYADFKKIFADQTLGGRIEYVNPSYGQSYLFNISGESIIRQFYYGMKKVKHHFPEAVFTSYSSEEPCFTSALPTILQSYGYKYASLKNPNTCWGGYTRAFGGELVNWIAPDNSSKLITVPRYAIEALQPNSTWQTISWNNSKQYIDAALKYGIANPVGMCLQDAGWKNGPWLGDGSRSYNPSIYKTWRDYIANVSIKTPSQDWKFSQEDMQVSLVWGSQILQRIGQQVRAAENKLVQAEKIAAINTVHGQQPWPAEVFELSWRPLLLAQHHDCWIVPYNRKFNTNWAGMVERWTKVSNGNADSLIYKNSDRSDLTSARQLRVYNTLGFDRQEWVHASVDAGLLTGAINITDQLGRVVVSQISRSDSGNQLLIKFKATVPAMGYSNFMISAGTEKKLAAGGVKKLPDGTYKLESDLYSIIIDPVRGGVIKSLVAKKLGNREFVDTKNKRGFNELRGNFFKDGGFHSSMDNPASITITEDGPALKKITINGTIAGHPFTQQISLSDGQKRIDLKTKINWKSNVGIGNAYAQDVKWDQKDYHKAFYDDRDKLLVLFPSPVSQKLYKNAPFDVTSSKNENTFFSTWDSIKHNIILNWVDIADATDAYGLAVLSDHTTSYVHGKDHPLGITMQYSGMGLWGRNYTITGAMEVNYSLIPHKGKWDNAGIYTETEKWNEPLIAVVSDASDKSAPFPGIVNSGDQLHLSSVTVEGGDLLVRVFNAESDNKPKKITFNLQATKMELIELDGAVKNSLTVKSEAGGRSSVMISVPRFGFRTIRIPGLVK